MRLVLTLIARDEGDIVDAQIAFHLNAGVDFVVAIDNGSQDGTIEILESYASAGYLHLIRDLGDLKQGEWTTRLARLAATEFGADWVINSDVDGFWWPRGGSLKEILSAVPPRFGCVRGMVRNFVPRPGDGFFAERMTVRVCNPGAEVNSPYSPRFQTVHRAHPEVVVNPGNHHAFGRGLTPLHGWYPFDMLHFPIRSAEQCQRKYVRWWEVVSRSGSRPSAIWEAARDARRSGRTREFYESYVVNDDELAEGVAEGTLAIDTRLRDVLRSLGTPDRRGLREFELPSGGEPLRSFDSVDEAYLSELAALEGSLLLVRAQQRGDRLEARLAALEGRFSARLGRGIRRRWQRLTAGVRR